MAPSHDEGTRLFPDVGNVHSARSGIDRHGAVRVVPMKVLCLGCSRTGTASVRNALKRLGYIDAYHGFSCIVENPLDGKFWLEGKCPRAGKYEGRTFGRDDFDQILGHCQAALDFPSICFSEELMEAYPDAKIILTLRDEDSWVRSMRDCLYDSIANPNWRLKRIVSEALGLHWQYAARVMDIFVVGFYGADLETRGREVFREQNDLVRRACANNPGRLLEWHVGDGWEPICEFLGESVPPVTFPKGNETSAYNDRMQKHRAFLGRDWMASKVLAVLDNPLAALCAVATALICADAIYSRRSHTNSFSETVRRYMYTR